MDQDQALMEIVGLCRNAVALSDHEELLILSDRVLELHDHLMHGGQLPVAWLHRNENYQDAAREAQYEVQLFMAWVLHQQGEEELRIPVEDLAALDRTTIKRWADPATEELVFVLADRPRHLNVVEETSG